MTRLPLRRRAAAGGAAGSCARLLVVVEVDLVSVRYWRTGQNSMPRLCNRELCEDRFSVNDFPTDHVGRLAVVDRAPMVNCYDLSGAQSFRLSARQIVNHYPVTGAEHEPLVMAPPSMEQRHSRNPNVDNLLSIHDNEVQARIRGKIPTSRELHRRQRQHFFNRSRHFNHGGVRASSPASQERTRVTRGSLSSATADRAWPERRPARAAHPTGARLRFSRPQCSTVASARLAPPPLMMLYYSHCVANAATLLGGANAPDHRSG